MIPSAFVTVDALPLNPNSKLDQRALPEFDPALLQPHHGYIAPRSELEENLVKIWTEVLDVEKIGVLDNFFELGGHSLLAAKVIARVRKYLGVEMPMRSMFEAPTVADLAAALPKARADGRLSPTIVPGRFGQNREQLETRLRALSDEEIDALLTAALANRIETVRGDD
jgi:acyl carrier protein